MIKDKSNEDTIATLYSIGEYKLENFELTDNNKVFVSYLNKEALCIILSSEVHVLQ